MVIVAQLVRASDCGSEGRGFETRLSPLTLESPEVNSGLFLWNKLSLNRGINFIRHCKCQNILNTDFGLVWIDNFVKTCTGNSVVVEGFIFSGDFL